MTKRVKTKENATVGSLDLRAGTPGKKAMRTPPQPKDEVISVAVRAEKRSRKAVLKLTGTKLALQQDATGQNRKDFLQPVEEFGLFECQTCTLVMVSTTGLKATAKGTKIKVNVKRSGRKTFLVLK
jgi:hypothetical protein